MMFLHFPKRPQLNQFLASTGHTAIPLPLHTQHHEQYQIEEQQYDVTVFYLVRDLKVVVLRVHYEGH